MNTTINKRSFQAIYRFLDNFNPLGPARGAAQNGGEELDCGRLCGAACCLCSTEPTDSTPASDTDENADFSMGLYLLPGEEQLYTFEEEWISWGFLQADEYDFPDSWTGRVPFFQCTTPPFCPREKRPLQCRTYPLAPHLDEDGFLYMIYHQDPLPYVCPLVADRRHHPLDPAFVKATWTAWKHLIRDPLIRDMVDLDSLIREEEGWPVEIVYP